MAWKGITTGLSRKLGWRTREAYASALRGPSSFTPWFKEQLAQGDDLPSMMRKVRLLLVREALRHTAGNKSAAARLLRVHRNSLGRNAKRLGATR